MPGITAKAVFTYALLGSSVAGATRSSAAADLRAPDLTFSHSAHTLGEDSAVHNRPGGKRGTNERRAHATELAQIEKDLRELGLFSTFSSLSVAPELNTVSGSAGQYQWRADQAAADLAAGNRNGRTLKDYYIDHDGRRHEIYPETDISHLEYQIVRDERRVSADEEARYERAEQHSIDEQYIREQRLADINTFFNGRRLQAAAKISDGAAAHTTQLTKA